MNSEYFLIQVNELDAVPVVRFEWNILGRTNLDWDQREDL
jgi:hypothetical protein